MVGIRVLDELFKSMQIEKKTIKVKPNWLDHLREKNGDPQVPVVENPLRPRFRVHVIRPALRQVEEEEEEEEDDLVDEEEEEESDITEVEGINHAHLGFQDQSEVESEPSVNG
ncbi:unnamed protein product [Lupinus luteus]|uniref:Uncharacterized protein n=1 Tax=Lupinus luteus TaxID=3873 RepID=A0AAV1XDM5_LUPLU